MDSRYYDDYTDDEAAGKGGRDDYASGRHDTNEDGAIDLKSEFNFHAAVNAAKRDRKSSEEAPTDFSGSAIEGFLRGRAIIDAADGNPSGEQMEDLVAARDQAVLAWENAITATVVHYINDTLSKMNDFGTEDYNFADHAKYWSEMKGFALGLQFNPRSQLSDEEFAEVLTLMRDAPVLPGDANVEAYEADLLRARDIIGAAYGFAEPNLTGW